MKVAMKMLQLLVIVLFLFLITILLYKSEKEDYVDPLYLNRSKLIEDIYPRANGSIYGFPHRLGGSWDIFSGYPYTFTAV